MIHKIEIIFLIDRDMLILKCLNNTKLMLQGFSGATRNKHINSQLTSLSLIGGKDCGNTEPDLKVKGGAKIQKTLCVKGNTVLKELTVKNDEVVKGNLTVNNLIVTGNATGSFGGGGGGGGGYQFSTFMNKPMSTYSFETQPGGFVFTANLPATIAGHLYTGPIGVPLEVKFIFAENTYGVPTSLSNFFIQEATIGAMNGLISGNVNTISSPVFTDLAVLSNNSFIQPHIATYPATTLKSTTVIPTLENSYWHYYCTPQGGGLATQDNQLIHSIHVTQL